MSGYVLQPTAQEDLADIRDYYLEEASDRVARQMLIEFVTFRFLARNPGAGHTREDLAERRPLLWPMRNYRILYKPGTDPPPIITMARGSRGIPRILRRMNVF